MRDVGQDCYEFNCYYWLNGFKCEKLSCRICCKDYMKNTDPRRDKIEEKDTIKDMIKTPWRYKRNPDTEKAYKELELRKEIKLRTSSKYNTTTLENLNPGDKIIRTKDWGDFKLRKNGRVTLSIGNEIIKVTPIKK